MEFSYVRQPMTSSCSKCRTVHRRLCNREMPIRCFYVVNLFLVKNILRRHNTYYVFSLTLFKVADTFHTCSTSTYLSHYTYSNLF